MRQVSIKQLNKHLSAELNDLPFEITRNGKVIGIVCTYVPIIDSVHIGRISDMKSDSVHKGTDLIHKGTDKQPVISTDNGKGTDNKVVIKGRLHPNVEKHYREKRKPLTLVGKPGVNPWVNPLANSILAPKT